MQTAGTHGPNAQYDIETCSSFSRLVYFDVYRSIGSLLKSLRRKQASRQLRVLLQIATTSQVFEGFAGPNFGS